MKTIPCRIVTIVALAGALLVPPAQAARKVDLSAFRGTYKGDMAVDVGGFIVPGTTKVKFNVARSGGSAKVFISGNVVFQGDIPVGALLTLQRNGKCKVSQLKLGQSVPVDPGAGTYRQKSPTKVIGKATAMAGGQKLAFDCTMNVKGRTKKTMRGDIVITLDGAPFATISVDARGR